MHAKLQKSLESAAIKIPFLRKNQVTPITIPLTFCKKHPIIPLTFCRKWPIIPLTFCYIPENH